MSNDEQKKKGTSEDLSKRILDSLPSFTGEETKRWIINMQEDGAEQGGVSSATPKLGTQLVQDGKQSELRLSTVALVDKMFDDFQRYVFEFNKATNMPDLKVQCERPEKAKQDKTSGNWNAVTIQCEGHLITTHWALVVHAETERVMCYICPADYVIGFIKRRKDFQPFAVIQSHIDKGKQFWESDGFSISFEVLPTLSKLIFEGLIRVARGEASEHEQLSLGPKKAKPAGPAQPSMPKPLRDHEPELYTADDDASGITPAAPSAVASTSSISQKRSAEMYGTPLSPAPSQSLSKLQATGDYSDLLSAFAQLVSIVDANSNALTQDGVDAMQSQDVVSVVQIMKRTAALKQLRQDLNQFMSEWQKAASE